MGAFSPDAPTLERWARRMGHLDMLETTLDKLDQRAAR
jgi:hypothetical protein